MPKIIKHHKRILEVSDDHKQITLPDSRFYRRNKEYYPSITHVLSIYPKGKHFEEWLKKVGYASNYIVQKSADEGTQVHEMIEQYLLGEKIKFLKNDIPQYPINVWNMFQRFVEFWDTYKPELLKTEIHLFSDELKVAGTCDLVCKIDGEIWIIDFKTSNQLNNAYYLQTAIYRKCYEECFNIKVKNSAVLWLKSSKRKFNKEKMWGKGWEISLSPRKYEDDLRIFKNLLEIFKVENPYDKPKFTHFKNSYVLSK